MWIRTYICMRNESLGWWSCFLPVMQRMEVVEGTEGPSHPHTKSPGCQAGGIKITCPQRPTYWRPPPCSTQTSNIRSVKCTGQLGGGGWCWLKGEVLSTLPCPSFFNVKQRHLMRHKGGMLFSASACESRIDYYSALINHWRWSIETLTYTNLCDDLAAALQRLPLCPLTAPPSVSPSSATSRLFMFPCLL